MLQDSGVAALRPPAGPRLTGDTDLNLNTVDGGVINYVANGPVIILDTNSLVAPKTCGAAAPADLAAAIGAARSPTRPARVRYDCTRRAPATARHRDPEPVQHRVGAAGPQHLAGRFGFTSTAGGAAIAATYTRFPAIGPAATFNAGTAPIAFIQPFYAIVLSVGTGTINAALPSASTAQTANTTSVITASLFRSTTNPCQVVTGLSGFICGNALFGVGAPAC